MYLHLFYFCFFHGFKHLYVDACCAADCSVTLYNIHSVIQRNELPKVSKSKLASFQNCVALCTNQHIEKWTYVINVLWSFLINGSPVSCEVKDPWNTFSREGTIHSLTQYTQCGEREGRMVLDKGNYCNEKTSAVLNIYWGCQVEVWGQPWCCYILYLALY